MFIHLHCHSIYSFFDGAARIESLVATAALHGMSSLALTDHNTITGLPEFHQWCHIYGIKPISGAELTLEDGSHITVIAKNKSGYSNLCKILTSAYGGPAPWNINSVYRKVSLSKRKNPYVTMESLFQNKEGLIVLTGCRRSRLVQLLLAKRYRDAEEWMAWLKKHFAENIYLEMQCNGFPGEHVLLALMKHLSEHVGVPLCATGNVHYVDRHDYPIHDLLRCMGVPQHVWVPSAIRPLNDRQWLYSSEEACHRFSEYPEAISNTYKISEMCEVVLRIGETTFPEFSKCSSSHQQLSLKELVYQGAQERYSTLTDKIRFRLEYELEIIQNLGYEDYFLIVWDVVRFARSKGIRCSGRGSAADSAVAFCLFITDVDSISRGLLFERFLSIERAERPDIDVDVEADRRDELMQYVYDSYGFERVARIATYQTFRGRMAVRAIGAALGLPEAFIDDLAKRIPGMASADGLESLLQNVPELRAYSAFYKQVQLLWNMASQIAGFPRHFGMHVGGVVISAKPLYEFTSLQPSGKGEWMTAFDKEGVEAVGLMKLDLLSLRTLSAVEGTVKLSEVTSGQIDFGKIPLDDEPTFEMIRQGETIGVFQLESPAQRALQSRLRADRMEDIIASVALIRPGPIQGNMVDPFLERRHGKSPILYLHPKLEPILRKTYGVVLFQEQVIEIATAIAHFTPGEADQLRRVMSKARSAHEIKKIGETFIDRAVQSGVDVKTAEDIFHYVQGYAGYGFCEAHAAAFGTLAYKTAYLVKHYPAEFFASIINQSPMGYYPIHVLCSEAKRRGVAVLGLDVNESECECMATNQTTVRFGWMQLKGMPRALSEQIVRIRNASGRFAGVQDFIQRVPEINRWMLENMIRAGAFDGVMRKTREEILWKLPEWLAYREWNMSPLGRLNKAMVSVDERYIQENIGEKVAWSDSATHNEEIAVKNLEIQILDEYSLLGNGFSGHWMTLYRPKLAGRGYLFIESLDSLGDGAMVQIAGLVVRPHRPPTKSGQTVVFFTVEDETGIVDATMFHSVYQKSGGVLFTPRGRMVGLRGILQRRGGNRPNVMVSTIWTLMRGSEI